MFITMSSNVIGLYISKLLIPFLTVQHVPDAPKIVIGAAPGVLSTENEDKHLSSAFF